LESQKKTSIIKNFRLHEGDTGSTEVQVSVLTTRINQLTKHMATNSHDFNTKRSLLKLIGQRRRLLTYLSKQDLSRYQKLIERLGLRK
jgi:small subunit ribosomal protein S15